MESQNMTWGMANFHLCFPFHQNRPYSFKTNSPNPGLLKARSARRAFPFSLLTKLKPYFSSSSARSWATFSCKPSTKLSTSARHDEESKRATSRSSNSWSDRGGPWTKRNCKSSALVRFRVPDASRHFFASSCFILVSILTKSSSPCR